MKNAIETRDVNLIIGNTQILKNVTVSFEEGKIHGLIGRK